MIQNVKRARTHCGYDFEIIERIKAHFKGKITQPLWFFALKKENYELTRSWCPRFRSWCPRPMNWFPGLLPWLSDWLHHLDVPRLWLLLCPGICLNLVPYRNRIPNWSWSWPGISWLRCRLPEWSWDWFTSRLKPGSGGWRWITLWTRPVVIVIIYCNDPLFSISSFGESEQYWW